MEQAILALPPPVYTDVHYRIARASCSGQKDRERRVPAGKGECAARLITTRHGVAALGSGTEGIDSSQALASQGAYAACKSC